MKHIIVLTLALLTLGLFIPQQQAHAATFTVTNNANGVVPGSLGFAITQAIANAGPDTINFAPGVTGVIDPGLSIAVLEPLTITGPGAGVVTISGGNARTVIVIAPTGTLNISGVTIANGNFIAGGGILNAGTLNVSGVNFTGNTAGDGGAIANGGNMSISNSTFTGNTSGDDGGAIVNAGAGTISGSTFTGNTAADHGGAVGNGTFDIYGPGTLTITNSVFNNNNAPTGGSAVAQNDLATTTVTSSCFSGNGGTAVATLDGTPLNAISNFWGTADGPSGNGPGSGDGVGANVSFLPFLTSCSGAGAGGGDNLIPNDGRLNLQHGDMDFVLYNGADANGDTTIQVYAVTVESTGVLIMIVTVDDLAPFVDNPPSINTLIRCADADGRVCLYALTSGEFQINAGPVVDGKVFVFIFDGLPNTYLHTTEFFID